SISIDYSSTRAIPGASVNIYNTTRKQVVAHGLTNTTGAITFAIWKDATRLELQVQKEEYPPYAGPINRNLLNVTRMTQPYGIQISGIARRPSGGPFVSTRVV